MNIKKKLTIVIFAVAIMFIGIPTMNVQAASNDNKIISDNDVTVKEAKNWAKSKGATKTFIGLADLYWEYAEDCGDVNPAIAYVQSAKETGYGNFTGVLDESYNNPCGLKTAAGGDDNDKNAHEKFDNWDEGVQAHMDHLALYAGAKGYPKSDSYDPRNFRTIKGKAKTVKELSGVWAPSSTYGKEVNALYNDLLRYSGAKVEDSDDKGNSSNVLPNPAIPENKPSLPNINEVTNNQNSDNVNISSNIGWKYANGYWLYYKLDNTKANGWINPDGNWYYLDQNGYMKNGWINLNNTWYYLKSSGAMAKGWLNINGTWYYLKDSGAMVNGLNKINNKIYYFDNSGSMKVGWEKVNNYWYYFSLSGDMQIGWLNINGTSYYLYDTGAMAKGWINVDNNWYFLNDDGSLAKGWILSNGDNYYLDGNTGKMIVDSVIGGYVIGLDGKRLGLSSDKESNKYNDKNKDKDMKKDNDKNSEEKTIVIDAGHDYGKDYGSENKIDGTTYSETDLNIQVASKLKSELEDRGFNVIMTRKAKERPSYGSLTASLSHKTDTANDENADFFISIHHNSAVETAKGVETYYSTAPKDDKYGGNLDYNRLEKSKKMAKVINDSIVKVIDTKNRGAKSDSERTLFVLRNTNMPAVLVEVGFITNTEEAERCADSYYQKKVAKAIAEAIDENFNIISNK
ncbi:N-acetylmuramoyl-L-alanine amidase [Clostridium sp. CMCC3677]|uniref:N-acetylmuramoyl-L-alanine amidase n=1 Tax=Clostridium sp. CMCC3677 TaxID=2949963 RepID=UPI0013F04675|nr:N-acetylmuramoyl-L-alanine amidase [Clostridium sp. CMCC3677]NFG62913.1 cell wall hydrolase [Clostridium botulinum]NFQ08704.1 cell wall hydrolase [Clostridium botulinum]